LGTWQEFREKYAHDYFRDAQLDETSEFVGEKPPRVSGTPP